MLLAVRGDLQSETGWSRATRALVGAVAADFDTVVGVDLHFHPAKSTSKFPGAVLDGDGALAKLLAGGRSNVVLHATLPDGIFCLPNALNIGWWFWETDRIPTEGDWPERLGSLDVIMVPSAWQGEVVQRLGLGVPVVVAPWPHGLSPSDYQTSPYDAESLRTSPVYKHCDRDRYLGMLDIDRRFHMTAEGAINPGALSEAKRALFEAQRTTFAEALGSYDGYFFAVQSDAPRKGLAPLIREWCTYKKRARTHRALCIRYSSLDVRMDAASIYNRFWETALMAAAGDAGIEDICLVLSPLTDSELLLAYQGATAFVSGTLGEGFGGTLVEAIGMGCPIIAPRHTACGQLVPETYPGAFPSVPVVGAMVGQLPQQPANGGWHPPVPGTIADRLLWAEGLSAVERDDTVTLLREHMRQALAPEHAATAMREAISLARDAHATAAAARARRGARA